MGIQVLHRSGFQLLFRVGLAIIIVGMTGCGPSRLALSRHGQMQLAQLTHPIDPGVFPDHLVEAGRIDAGARRKVYALFGNAVILRIRSDQYRMMAQGRRPAYDELKGLPPKELYRRADKLWQEAVKGFQEVLKRDPQADRAAFQLAMGYLDRKRLDDGLRYL